MRTLRHKRNSPSSRKAGGAANPARAAPKHRMSLTSYIHRKDVRPRFREAIPKPRFRCEAPMKAPPRTKNYARVGAAADYLIRFYSEHLNPGAVARPWVAEKGLEKIPDGWPTRDDARRRFEAAKE